MQRLFYAGALIGILAVSGCAREKAAVEPPRFASNPALVSTNAAPSGKNLKGLIVTPDEGLTGKVVWVNSNLRFAVLSFPIGQMPALELRLNVYRNGLKVGELKVSGPQRDDNIVADIVAGDAQVGDVVRTP